MFRFERNALAEIFEDTQLHYSTNEKLIEAIRYTKENQVIVPQGPMLNDNSVTKRYEKTNIIISKKRSFEAASDYKDKKVAVLNFANAYHAGGGVISGAGAQEECLCRCSTLYANLTDRNVLNNFHNKHYYLAKLAKRVHFNNLANDDCVYSPRVIVFKTDTDRLEMMPEEEWYEVDIITCAAPDLHGAFYSQSKEVIMPTDKELLDIHIKRGRRILEIAKRQGDEVVILGAFGCGAFQNNPEIVAKAYKMLMEEFNGCFETIEFAIYSGSDETNFRAFSSELKPLS